MSADPPLNIFTLPLFPLHCVLFPQFPLRLHIFEERYKVMINGCIERNEPFGVVLIREGQEVGAPATPYEIGCVARILAVKRLEDGRMHLLAAGESRFRLLDYVEADLPYLIGRAEAVAETAYLSGELAPLAQEAGEVFRRYLTLVAERANLALPEIELPADPTLLTFCIASVAQLPLEDKQRLLEMSDTRLRLQTEIALLREHSALLKQTEPATVAPLQPDAEFWQYYRHNARN
jgi:Lon protease-like protein